MGATTFCQGDSVLLIAGNGTACYSYQWQLNNQDIPGATSATYYAKLSGAYKVKVSQSGLLAKSSTTISVLTNAPSIPTISIINDTLQASVANQYQWYYSSDSVNYTSILGAIQQTYVVPQSGYYYIKITDASGCSSNSLTQYVNITDVLSISGLTSISIRPNPSNEGKFYLRAAVAGIRPEWKVYNLIGDEVQK
ncbi:MAG: hypothetical protein IPP32_01140 [Bacteroidetes bacterium]|nr:hypothetical protein [Bacteroidota bacterium]